MTAFKLRAFKPLFHVMKLKPQLIQATLIKRYKRFLADVRLADGQVITAHCPNTGSMKNCVLPDSPCWLSVAKNPKRKYPHTWEIATVAGGHRACINTGRANTLIEEGIQNGVIAELQGYEQLEREVPYGNERSRIDILLQNAGDSTQPRCYVEVKSVTYGSGGGIGYFPDAISIRASKHLRELIHVVEQGQRGVIFFCVQHSGITCVKPADHIDPQYGVLLRKAVEQGVEVLAYRVAISAREMVIAQSVEFVCDEL